MGDEEQCDEDDKDEEDDELMMREKKVLLVFKFSILIFSRVHSRRTRGVLGSLMNCKAIYNNMYQICIKM